jgi:hypothetical protein
MTRSRPLTADLQGSRLDGMDIALCSLSRSASSCLLDIGEGSRRQSLCVEHAQSRTVLRTKRDTTATPTCIESSEGSEGDRFRMSAQLSSAHLSSCHEDRDTASVKGNVDLQTLILISLDIGN